MIHMCAWCKATIEDFGGKGRKAISHGICPACRKEHFPETLRTVQENAAVIVREGRS